MRFLRHLIQLLVDVYGFAMKNKAWWTISIVAVLLIAASLIAATQTITPFIYTMF